MTFLRRVLCGAIFGAVVCSLGQVPSVNFDGAKWIWYSREPMPISQSFPAGVHYFRAHLTVPALAEVKTAQVMIAADNLYSLYLNGELMGESAADPNWWSRAKRFDVKAWLHAGENTVAIEAVNTVPGPAALLAKLALKLTDGSQVVLVTDESWKCRDGEETNWFKADFDDARWQAVHVVGSYGMAPWGRLAMPAQAEPAGGKINASRQEVRDALEEHKASARRGGIPLPRRTAEITPPANYPWPEAVIFVGEDCSLYRPAANTGNSYDSLNVTIFNPRDSRAYPEHDLPAPMKVGHKLFLLAPARPGVTPRVLVDAGQGALGSPTVSFDGKTIYFSMVPAQEAFFHIYRVGADGTGLKQLTQGPFHDIDPAELPDGRVVFTSTRIGTFEEYHNPPSRSLFTMKEDGSSITPLTYTFIFDNEPEVLADGRILMIRSDNFFDRGKVETLLHAIHPDGSSGYTEFGLDLGPEYGGRLRAFNCGSPAPLPDGRVAYLSDTGIDIGRPGSLPRQMQRVRIEAGDVAALPDGRLLCTLPTRTPVQSKRKRIVQDYSYEKLALFDPAARKEEVVVVLDSPGEPIHSPVFLGPRANPPVLARKADTYKADDPDATGILFCQNARFTKNTTAGWSQVRAIRVLAGKGLNVRSSHSYIVHAGSEVTELGTVPLAMDGSFAVEVPADTAIAFQAVDAEGRSELNEMSWIYVRPGETRGCVGCHQPRQVTPPATTTSPLALRSRPLRLLGKGRSLRFRGNNAAVTGLMELQLDRYREVAGLNRHAESSNPLLSGTDEIAGLIAQVKGAEPDLQISAAQQLSVFRTPLAAAALAEGLRVENREVRVATALALATCGTRDSIPALLNALMDTEPLVGQSAAIALENLVAHAEPFDAFAPMQERDAQARRWRDWFSSNSFARIEQRLVGELQSAHREQVRRAAVALGHIGSPAVGGPLLEYVSAARQNNPLPDWRKDHSHRGDGAQFNSLSAVNPRTLQAAVRALGRAQEPRAVALLAETLAQHRDPEQANLFLVEAAVQALGYIGTPEAEKALLQAFAGFKTYQDYTSWYGDHGALMACHASPPHFYVLEALDAMGCTRTAPIISHLIRSVPTDMDRALFPQNDDYETLVGRLLRRGGHEALVIETCLAVLGDTNFTADRGVQKALAETHGAWGGKPDEQNRAAQILSLVCRDRKYESPVRSALVRFAALTNDIPRVFDAGIPVVTKLPAKHWVCFFLARALGNLSDSQSVPALLAILEHSAPESAPGYPDPLGPGVLFLHNDLTPCWRAAVAWALGEIGDKRAAPLLLALIKDFNNSPDTRHAAARALVQLKEPSSSGALNVLARDYPDIATRRVLLGFDAPRSRQPGVLGHEKSGTGTFQSARQNGNPPQ